MVASAFPMETMPVEHQTTLGVFPHLLQVFLYLLY